MSDRIDVSATIKVNDQASTAIGRVRDALGGIGDKAKSVADSFKSLGTWDNFGKGVSQLGSALGQLGRTVMNVAKPIAALVGIAGGLSMAEAVAGMERYVSSVRELSRTAPVLGTTIENLSALQFAASRVGIGANELSNALARANANIGRAATGKGTQLTALFDKLGISLRDSNGHIRTTADLMPTLADAFARQTDPVVQLRMATELFGRAAGPEMLKLLQQGSSGIEAFIERGRELGLVIGEEQAEKARAFAKAQAEVGLAWQSLGVQLSQNLMPILQPLIENFGKLLHELRPTIVVALTEAFQTLADALQSVNWEETIKSGIEWVKWINEVVNNTVGWKGVLVGFAAFLAGPMIAAMISVGAAVANLAAIIGSAMLANPILAVIAALAAGGLLIWKNWDGISEYFSGLWADVSEGVGAGWDKIASLAESAAGGIEGAWDGMTDFFGDIGERIASAFSWYNLQTAWSGIVDWFQTLWDNVRGVFDVVNAWLGPWANLFAPLAIYNNWDALADFFDNLWKRVAAIFEWAWSVIKPIIDGLRDGLTWLLDKLPPMSGIANTAASVGKTVFSAPGRALDWTGEQLGRIWPWGGGGRAEPSVVEQAAQRSVVEQATTAQQINGRVEVDANIHLAGAPPGTTVEAHTREEGAVRATGDVGLSMVPA